MADSNPKATQVEAKGGTPGSWLATAPAFFREVRLEARKINWPTWKETYTTGIMVAIMSTITALFFLGVDQVFASVVKFLIGLAK